MAATPRLKSEIEFITPGEIASSTVYLIPRFQRLMKISRPKLRELRESGLPIRRIPGTKSQVIRGADWFAFVGGLENCREMGVD